jgi:hypothetical protein
MQDRKPTARRKPFATHGRTIHFRVKRKSDFGSPGPAPAHQRAAGGVIARQPEILFARHTLPPAAGVPASLGHPSPHHDAALAQDGGNARRAAVELAVEGRLRPAALAQHLADRNATGGSQGAQVESQKPLTIY